MRLLLDTHVLIRLATDRREVMPDSALRAYEAAEQVNISVVSEWEIAIKRSLGRLTWHAEFVARYEAGLRENRVRWLDVTRAHCERVASLPLHHRDPFDRMLVAQAQVEGLSLLSADGLISAYDVAVVW